MPFAAIIPAVAAAASAVSAGTGLAQGIDAMSKSGGGGGGQVDQTNFNPNDTIRSPEEIAAQKAQYGEAVKNAQDPNLYLNGYIQQYGNANTKGIHEAKRMQEELRNMEYWKTRGDQGRYAEAVKHFNESSAEFQKADPQAYSKFQTNYRAFEMKQSGEPVETITEKLYNEAAAQQQVADQDAAYARGREYKPADLTRYDQAYGQQRDQLNSDINAAQQARANDVSVQHLQQLANGQGPAAEAAQAQLRAGLSAANQQAMSQAASARGGAGSRALASRAALMSGAQNSQTAANQGAQMRAQMSMQGIQGLAQQRAENMQQDVNLYGQRTDSGMKNALFLGDTAQRDAQGRIMNNSVNDAAVNAARNRGLQYYGMKSDIPYRNAQTAQQGQAIASGAANNAAGTQLARDKYGTGLILGAGQGVTQAGDYWSKYFGDKKDATTTATPPTGPATPQEQEEWRNSE